MKKVSLILFGIFSLAACSKEDVRDLPKPAPQENHPPDQQPNDPSKPPASIVLRAVIKVGDIIYDSIPASIGLEIWENQERKSLSYHQLEPGNNRVQLPSTSGIYKIRFSKWGINEELTLAPKDVIADSVYTLGGQKKAKKLKAEYDYVLKEGIYQPERKVEYFYQDDESLKKIVYHAKKANGEPYVSLVSNFDYQEGKLKSILNYDENENQTGSIKFFYDARGRVAGMTKSGTDEAYADVEYSRQDKEIVIRYTYPGKTYSMLYVMQINEGNLAFYNASTSNHGGEQGNYQYDLQINPYVHMNWPDFMLTHTSKNNIIASSQSYYGAYPVAVASGYNYTYDGDGYPKELVKTYKAYLTGQYLYSTKTVYVY